MEVVSLTAGSMTAFDAVIGDGLYANQDIDLYRIELGAEQSISIDIDADLSDDGSNLSDLDSLIRVFDSLGRDVTSSVGVVRSGDAAAPGDFDDGNGTVESADDYLSWTAIEAGVYFIGISSYLRNTGAISDAFEVADEMTSCQLPTRQNTPKALQPLAGGRA